MDMKKESRVSQLELENDLAFQRAEIEQEQAAFQAKMDREMDQVEAVKRVFDGVVVAPESETDKTDPRFIRHMLETDPRWLERGILAIYRNQTRDEQSAEQTKYHNGIGFNGPDAHYMSYVSKWLLSGKHLSGQHVEKARRKMLKYSFQLSQIAKEAV